MELTDELTICTMIEEKFGLAFYAVLNGMTKDTVSYKSTYYHDINPSVVKPSKVSHPRQNKTLRCADALWKVTMLLADAKTIKQVAKIIIDEGFSTLNVQSGDVALIKPDGGLDIIAARGYAKNFSYLWSNLPKNSPLLTTDVVRTKKPLFIKSVKDIDNKYKAAKLFIKSSGTKSSAVIPLINKRKVIGVIQFSYTEPQAFSYQDRLFTTTLANQCALSFDRVTTHQELRAAKDQLETVLTNTEDGVVIQTSDGEVAYMNNTAAEMFGLKSSKSAIGKNWTEVINRFSLSDEQDEEFSFEKGLVKRRKQIKSRERVLKITKKSTQDVTWVLFKSKRIKKYVDKSELTFYSFHDITHMKELERRKDEFISLVSHEIKTPLTSMKLFLDLLTIELKRNGDEKSKLLSKKTGEQLNRLQKLTTELLDMSRIQKGKLPMNKERFLLHELLESTIDDLQLFTKSHLLVLEKSPSIQVYADKFRVYQVLINLINNAVKYSPKGKKIIIKLEKVRGQAKISVQDFGIGIKKTDQKKIFDRFFQVQPGSITSTPGLGIGLFISNEIVRAHKGKIWVESKKGKGSSFNFTIPAVKSA